VPFIYTAIAGHRSADAFAAIVEMLQRTQYSLAARIGTGRLTWERTLLPGAFAKPKRPRKSVAAMPSLHLSFFPIEIAGYYSGTFRTQGSSE
jgi:hypothetical protein